MLTTVPDSAMATSAAPGFFRKWMIGDPPKPYVDGALLSNLPVTYALDEKERIWPTRTEHNYRQLDALVSVGTGIQDHGFHLPGWLDVASIGEVAQAYFDNIVDTQAVWQKFRDSGRYDSERHYRLNVNLKGASVGLDGWDQMKPLIEQVDTDYHTLHRFPSLAFDIEKVAYRLTAGLFFFEPDPQIAKNAVHEAKTTYMLDGCIWCRLEHGSEPFWSLMHRVTAFWLKEGNDPPTHIYLRPDWRSRLSVNGNKFAVRCRISTRDPSKLQTLSVTLGPPPVTETARWSSILETHEKTPISGFPITFSQLQANARMK